MVFDETIAKVARRQRGIVTRLDVLRAGGGDGATKLRLRNGRWQQLHPGVYLIGAAPPTFLQRVLAACYAAGPGAVASHRAAAVVWELDGAHEGPVELTCVQTSDPDPRRTILHRTLRWDERDRTRRRGIPVTTVNRTLIDYGAVVPRLLVERGVEDAINRGLTSEGGLRRAMGRSCGKGCRGCGTLRWVLDHRPEGKPARSGFEVILLDLIREYRLRIPHRNFTVRVDGEPVAEVDLAYVDRMIALEADGRRWHSTRRAHERDIARQRRLEELGWTVLRFTWDEVMHHPAAAAARIRAVLCASTAA
jgi:very-short-patch-repair endonuclease